MRVARLPRIGRAKSLLPMEWSFGGHAFNTQYKYRGSKPLRPLHAVVQAHYSGRTFAGRQTRDMDCVLFQKELQRIIALERSPADPNEAAVYAHFQWMKVVYDQAFTVSPEGEKIDFFQDSGMRLDESSATCCTLDWRNHAANDGDAVDVRLEEWQFGLKRVCITYSRDEQLIDDVVALCCHFPALPEHSLTCAKDILSSRTLLLPDGSPARICGMMVEMHPLVLTIPRVNLLQHIKEATSNKGRDGTAELLLSGVFGSGKSHMLEAISSILAHSGHSDFLFSRTASDMLSPHVDWLRAVSASSGPLGTLLDEAARDPSICTRKNEKIETGTCDSVARAMGGVPTAEAELALFKALMGYLDHPAQQGATRFMILDEMSDLLKRFGPHIEEDGADGRAANRHVSASWGKAPSYASWLQHRNKSERGGFHIFARSPDDSSETAEYVDSFPRFELLSPRADHLGAVLAVAPEYLALDDFNKQRVARIWGPGSGSAEARLSLCTAICEMLGSNMRDTLRFLRDVSDKPSPYPLAIASKSMAQQVQYLAKTLSGRVTHSVRSRVIRERLVARETLSDTAVCLRDASLTVPLGPAQPFGDFGAPQQLASKPALLAALCAFEYLHDWNLLPPQFAQEVSCVSFGDFKEQCAARIYLNTLSKQCIQLPAVHVENGEWAGGLGRPAAMYTDSKGISAADWRLCMPSYRQADPILLMSGASNRHEGSVQEAVVSVHSKLPNQRVVIQTLPGFPSDISAVEVDQGGRTTTVRVYIAMSTTIAQHADGKHVVDVVTPKSAAPVPAVDSSGGARGKAAPPAGDNAQYAFCEPAWGDMLQLCGVPSYCAALQPDGSVELKQKQLEASDMAAGDLMGSLSGGTSLINALLASLGVPLVVHAHRAPLKTAALAARNCRHGWKVTGPNLRLSVVKSSELCRELFGGDEDSDEWAHGGDYQLQVVLVSDTPQENNLKALMDSTYWLYAPFVQFVFKEQMQEVMPMKLLTSPAASVAQS